MDFNHSANCPHCQRGCTHPHAEHDELLLQVMECGVGVRGSKMRHGGSWTDPALGITLASDDWRRVRCKFCGDEMMTPVDMLPPPPFGALDRDGANLVACMTCLHDIGQGHKPGHNPHRRRRARRS